jgi:hypothetical protein
MVSQGLRCEWAKSKTRVDRWSEEVQLVTEEMRQVICYLDWKANWWVKQGTARTGLRGDITSSLAAYAAKQAYISQSLVNSFAVKWHHIHVRNNIPIQWPNTYIPTKVIQPYPVQTANTDEDDSEQQDLIHDYDFN